MTKPWIEEIKDEQGNFIKTICTVQTVVMPAAFPGKVPVGEIFPIGGASNPATEEVEYPVGYFVKPLRVGDKESLKRLGRIAKRASALDIDSTGENEDAIEQASRAIEELIEMAFLPYYGTEETNKIKELFTFSPVDMMFLVEAMKGTETREITCLK